MHIYAAWEWGAAFMSDLPDDARGDILSAVLHGSASHVSGTEQVDHMGNTVKSTFGILPYDVHNPEAVDRYGAK